MHENTALIELGQTFLAAIYRTQPPILNDNHAARNRLTDRTVALLAMLAELNQKRRPPDTYAALKSRHNWMFWANEQEFYDEASRAIFWGLVSHDNSIIVDKQGNDAGRRNRYSLTEKGQAALSDMQEAIRKLRQES